MTLEIVKSMARLSLVSLVLAAAVLVAAVPAGAAEGDRYWWAVAIAAETLVVSHII